MEDNYKPSNKFTDHAWSEMKALLDKEMPDKGAILIVPAEQRRKNFLLLLPLLLLLGIAALFFYYQSKNSFSNDLINDEIKTTELAILPSNSEESTKEISEESIGQEGNIDKVAKGNVENNISPLVTELTVTSKSNPTNSKSFNKLGVASTFSENKSAFVGSPFNTSTSIDDLGNEEEKLNTQNSIPLNLTPPEIEKIPAETQVEPIEEEKREPIAILNPIEGKRLTTLAYKSEQARVEKFLDIQELKRKLPIFAFVGARNYDFSNKIDFVANLETVFGKQGKKLGLRTGLNYAQRSTVYLTRELSIVNYDEDLVSNAVSANQLFNYERSQLSSNPIKYHFLEIPFMLDFKITKKWSLHGGISPKLLLFSSDQNFGLLNNLSFSTSDDIFATAQLEENFPGGLSDMMITFFEPKKINLGASLGFNFQASQRLGVQARFSQNLVDIYPQLPNVQRSSSIELGLSWRLR